MKALGWFLALILAGQVVSRAYHRWGDDSLRVTVFDVGQGDSILVQFPHGKTLLIDAGGGFGDWNTGKPLSLELARLGILTLDAALMTHPDQDHAYGFLGVFTELSVKEFWLNQTFREPPVRPVLGRLLDLARERQITVQGFDRRTPMQVGGVGLELFPLNAEKIKTNDRSLALWLQFQGCRALFIGDAEASGEALLAQLPLPTVDLLKVAHHGSKTSSTEPFLERFKPKLAVISVGRRNRYGHPNPGVVRRLEFHRAQVLRTDFHGYVRLKFSPAGKIECETYEGSCGIAECGRTH